MKKRLMKDVSMIVPNVIEADLGIDQMSEEVGLERGRKQASVRFRSKEDRYWDLRYDPNRQSARNYYWKD